MKILPAFILVAQAIAVASFQAAATTPDQTLVVTSNGAAKAERLELSAISPKSNRLEVSAGKTETAESTLAYVVGPGSSLLIRVPLYVVSPD